MNLVVNIFNKVSHAFLDVKVLLLKVTKVKLLINDDLLVVVLGNLLDNLI